jgi:hypothetical protein
MFRPGSARLIAALNLPNYHFMQLLALCEGEVLLLDGFRTLEDGYDRVLIAVDVASGRILWQDSQDWCDYPYREWGPVADATRTIVTYGIAFADGWLKVVEARSGKVIHTIHQSGAFVALGPEAQFCIRLNPLPGRSNELSLCRLEADDPLVSFDVGWDNSAFAFAPSFSRDGSLLAWGNADGTVSLCDLENLRGRLNEIGMGW